MPKNYTYNDIKSCAKKVPWDPPRKPQTPKNEICRLQNGVLMVSYAFLASRMVPRWPQDLEIIKKSPNAYQK